MRENWVRFEKVYDLPPVRLEIGVVEGPSEPVNPPAFRSRAHLLTIFSDMENFIVCDLVEGFGFGWLTESVVADTAFCRYFFLDAAMMVLLDQLYLTPVHGALLARNGRGVLLCGESHAGKSSLAYACAREGWTFICDDATSLLRSRNDRFAIGNPRTIRFKEEAGALFPELQSQLVATRPNGRAGIEVLTSDLGITTSNGCVVNDIVFLNRHAGGSPRLIPVSKCDAFRRVACGLHFGVQEVREARRKTYERILTAGLWQLDYENLESAVSRLDVLVGSGM